MIPCNRREVRVESRHSARAEFGGLFLVASLAAPASALAEPASAEFLVYHQIQTDTAGHIVPWYSTDPGTAYDHCIGLVWNFWQSLPPCPNGVPYVLQHMVWRPEHDSRGIAGSQPAMTMHSWSRLYAYSGNEAIKQDMIRIADYVLAHGASAPNCLWPNLYYPYNTDVHSGLYDGDMMGQFVPPAIGVLQPDKSAWFGAELIDLYRMTGRTDYLNAAVAIANTLADNVIAGDNDRSPWPFRVHAVTGEISSPYTTAWTGALRLFDGLIDLDAARADDYRDTRTSVIAWIQGYPMQTNRWGPFFEDVGIWSDTEINADTLALYILENPSWSSSWSQDARTILDWSKSTFGNSQWASYGVTAINEQTYYMVPGNSHTSRHWSLELLYAKKTGDHSRKDEAIRALNWATYMVDTDGKNRYPYDDIWLTDGYGDYVQHYLRAMAAAPELSPAGASHILQSESVVRNVVYASDRIAYTTFDRRSRELLRMAFAPQTVKADGVPLTRFRRVTVLDVNPGWVYDAATRVLHVRHVGAANVEILRN